MGLKLVAKINGRKKAKPQPQRDAEIFRQREERSRELTFDQKRAVAIYLVTNEALSGDGKWLRKVQPHRREHILIRNLSNMYK